MKFTGIPSGARRLLALGLAGGLLALAGCGGGTVIEPFRPTRVLAFGDELSAFSTDSATPNRKYSVNTINTTTSSYDCAPAPIWIQVLANNFLLGFVNCPITTTGAVNTSHTYAVAGAKVAGITSQIDNFQDGPFTGKDIVTVLAGMNDILEQYALYTDASSEAALKATLTARGHLLANQVNRVAALGAKVIVSTVPDLGVTPYALAEKAAHTDTDRAALLTRLTDAFNIGLKLNLTNDGHEIGLIFADVDIGNMARYPGSFGFTNVVSPVCLDAYNSTSKLDDAAVLPSCTTNSAKLVKVASDGSVDLTQTTVATPTSFLWAGNLLPGSTGHAQIGTAAVSRAVNNPF